MNVALTIGLDVTTKRGRRSRKGKKIFYNRRKGVGKKEISEGETKSGRV